MVFNFFRIAWRSILKHKTYAAINFVGLTCGLTLSLLIFTYMREEMRFDAFHEKLDRMYRIKYYGPNGLLLASTPPPIAPKMKEYFPEVEEAARVYSRSVSVSLGEVGNTVTSYEEPSVLFADSALVDIWSLDFVAGNKDRALKEPFTVVITDEMAKKYFGDKNPIGETLVFGGNQLFRVNAVVKKFPTTSHIQFGMLAPYDNMFDLESPETAQRLRNNLEVNFIISHSFTYVLLKPGADPGAVNSRFGDFIKKYAQPRVQRGQVFELFPVKDIHLKSDMLDEPIPANSYSTLIIFAGVGLLTLLIACINYINLATAQSFTRIKEIGMRKILGSDRIQLIGQFLMESFLFCAVAFILSLGGLYMTLPLLNMLTGSELVFLEVLDVQTISIAVILLFAVTILAGAYPSIFATRFDSVYAIKGAGGNPLSSGSYLRKVLVVFQLIIASVLISGSLMIVKQLRYIQNRPLGFNKENVIVVQLQSQNMNSIFSRGEENFDERLNSFRTTIESQSAVKSTALTSNLIGTGITFRGITPEGFSSEDNMFVANLEADYDFFETFDVKLVAGRTFNREVGSDPIDGVVVNETAVSEFKWGSAEQALGRTIDLEGRKAKVIGVIEDFNFNALTTPISALVISMGERYPLLSIRLLNANTQENIELLRSNWNKLFPEKTFEFFFLDERLDNQYRSYQNFGTIILYFTFIAVLISCLGVYGLILFVVQRKVKEIGVRKVLGSSVPAILKLIFMEFTWLILIAFVVAVPFSLYLITMWFENFIYHTSVDPFTYLLSFGIVLLTVGLTVYYNAYKAAAANPVTSLRSE